MNLTIIIAVMLLGILGVAFSVFLVVASKKLVVEVDKTVSDIFEILPKANCGACGFPGCMGYAEALGKPGSKVSVTLCSPGGSKTAEKIADILGATVEKTDRKTARILCRGEQEYIRYKFEYKGLNDCEMANKLLTGPKLCEFGCLMLGNCFRVCKFNAISFENGKIPVILEKKCVGCGACVTACPKNIITLLSEKNHVSVTCKNHDKGKTAKSKCDVACIACGLCKKICPVQAIEIVNNLSVIDYTKCIDCGKCHTVCPVKPIKSITDSIAPRPTLQITDDCKGCGLCLKKCPVQAISGNKKEKHVIDQSKCIKCQVCYNTCRFKAIKLIDSDVS
ncbi:RnfABCDGE type electron transport complex subunit B [Candidatus Dependentiae bacterium]|nr:RnfABCDGE type electron transport complex subunit B [Candidatus Dependentiae bacterium]